LTPRVITLGPLPPEKSAYALARYSRSADSIHESIEWVRTHDSTKFLDSFYFQYGHASIADLGHLALCFEGVSELAATEIEDEQLWDGQAKSSRYQDFSKLGVITPAEFSEEQADIYRTATAGLIDAYGVVHRRMVEYLENSLPRPDSMKPDAYQRNIAARAFDVARYLLPFGVPTNAGQVTSIRTLERQIRRMKASPYAELRSLGEEAAAACAEAPGCAWDDAAPEPVAPTLAKYCHPDEHWRSARQDLTQWAAQNLPPSSDQTCDMDLIQPSDITADIVATLLYPVTHRPFRELYNLAREWSTALRAEVIDVALRSRTQHDDLMREFRGGLYVFDIVMDIGAYRDLHRHRRCQQFRQEYSGLLGYSTPPALAPSGLLSEYRTAIESAFDTMRSLPAPGSHYLLPFGARGRFLFKMDFAEAEYISRLRSGVKGHFSYREVAWRMKGKLEELEPELARLIHATPPWEEDPLTR
jgi:thymidylate synthase ThyX